MITDPDVANPTQICLSNQIDEVQMITPMSNELNLELATCVLANASTGTG